MSFDRIARHYLWLETVVFGGALQRSRTRWIHEIPAPKRAVIVGEGNGRFLCELVRAHPATDIDCVDVSPRMLERARHRLSREAAGAGARILFLQSDIRSWTPSNSYDLVVSHFVLDCFESDEVEAIVEKLARAASPGAVWLLSDFTIPSKGWARGAARVLLAVMYTFFRITTGITARTLVDPAPYLAKHGFVRGSRSVSCAGVVQSDSWVRPYA
jgi:ubiquinone/menaquinone biosynthesis C-methylase UbiE